MFPLLAGYPDNGTGAFDTCGTLIIDNNDASASEYTELPSVPLGTSTSLSDAQLSNTVAALPHDDIYVDYLLNPNRSQGTARLTDDVSFTILSNTDTTISALEGTLTTSATYCSDCP
jgi:hypothetical protein